MTDNGVDTYFEACHLAFQDRPEAHRIALYIEHATRERGASWPFYRLAAACLDGGSISLWRQGVRIALTRAHDTPQCIDVRREALRRLGDWSGWQDVPWPTKGEDLPPTVDRWWDGSEDLSGKSLLVCDLGALGDVIRSLRFAEALREKVSAPIFWEVPQNLLEFVEYNLGHLPGMHAFNVERTDAHFDRALNGNLLPRLLGPLPPFVPRRAPSPVTLERANHARLGIAWACSIGRLDHLERSMPLRMLMPFFWRPDVEFYSLQVGTYAQEASPFPRLRIPDPPLESFADTANLIASLDGVITVDTSVAHLAGSLGTPTLTLLPLPGDILWSTADTTPWYPTMRFIRQRRTWDWLSVQARLKDALDARWWETIPRVGSGS
jgi:hypothetical protein